MAGGQRLDSGDYGVSVNAALQQTIGEEHAMGVGLRLGQSVHSAQHKMHSRERILALAPAVRSLAKVGDRALRWPSQMGHS
jgi:hypothetical protein